MFGVMPMAHNPLGAAMWSKYLGGYQDGNISAAEHTYEVDLTGRDGGMLLIATSGYRSSGDINMVSVSVGGVGLTRVTAGRDSGTSRRHVALWAGFSDAWDDTETVEVRAQAWTSFSRSIIGVWALHPDAVIFDNRYGSSGSVNVGVPEDAALIGYYSDQGTSNARTFTNGVDNDDGQTISGNMSNAYGSRAYESAVGSQNIAVNATSTPAGILGISYHLP